MWSPHIQDVSGKEGIALSSCFTLSSTGHNKRVSIYALPEFKAKNLASTATVSAMGTSLHKMSSTNDLKLSPCSECHMLSAG
jgi:hypothetical protein